MGARGSSCCDRMEVIPAEDVRAGVIPGDVTGPPELKEEPSVELEPRQVSFHWGQRLARLEAMKVLEVDREIIRSISLSSSLKRFGMLWQRSPTELKGADRTKLWEKSQPSDHFDVFLSHTWRTRGRWKVLSLLFQYCWPIVMVCWLCVVAVAFLLSSLGALPMPLVFKISVLGFQAACPAAPWALLSGSVAVLISLLLSPYILCNSPKCFLDVVSIHQTDSELMERGVYGLGGFLSVSQELRILWSPPYLSGSADRPLDKSLAAAEASQDQAEEAVCQTVEDKEAAVETEEPEALPEPKESKSQEEVASPSSRPPKSSAKKRTRR